MRRRAIPSLSASAAALVAAATALAAPPRLTLPDPLPARTVVLPVLMYHRVDALSPTLPAITRRLTVDPRDFAAQMQWLAAHGYHAVTERQAYDALERGRPLPSRPVLITFDDGYLDVLRNAAPVLRRLRMPATAFIITDRVGVRDTSGFLSWRDLRALEADGFDIGSHTVSHLDLPTLAPAQQRWQLSQSKRILEFRLRRPVQWFAYPAGRFDATVVADVRAAGYVLAMTTQPGTVQSAQHPLELHRYEVLDTTGVSGLAALLRG